MRHISILLLTACAPAVDPSPTAPADGEPTCEIAAPTDVLPLHTSGQTIRDAHGRMVLLRGVNTGGRSKFHPYMPFDFAEGDFEAALDAYLDRLVYWGFTTLRVPFSWAAFEPAPGDFDAAWLARYDALLDGAADRGMWTIVDFHQDVYGEWFCGDGFPAWTWDGEVGPDCHDDEGWFLRYLEDEEVKHAYDRFWANEDGIQDAFWAMWVQMATHQQGRPGVIGFELINEPYPGTTPGAEWGPATATPFYEHGAATVQAVVPDALIFFDSTGVDAVLQQTDLDRPDAANMVFAPHFYDPSIFFSGDTIEADVVAGMGGWADVGAAWDMPVLVGEYGVQPDRDGAGPYAAQHYEALDLYRMHGTWWEYSTSTELWNHEDLSITEADGSERDTLLDGIVVPYPRAIADDPGAAAPTWSWDPADRVFSLAYTGLAQGITEVILPPRLFAADPDIQLEGGCAQQDGSTVRVRAEGGPVSLEIRP